MVYSKAELSSNGNRASPCFKPFLIGNMSDSWAMNLLASHNGICFRKLTEFIEMFWGKFLCFGRTRLKLVMCWMNSTVSILRPANEGSFLLSWGRLLASQSLWTSLKYVSFFLLAILSVLISLNQWIWAPHPGRANLFKLNLCFWFAYLQLSNHLGISWRMKNQLDVTCYFISLIMRSTCFGH